MKNNLQNFTKIIKKNVLIVAVASLAVFSVVVTSSLLLSTGRLLTALAKNSPDGQIAKFNCSFITGWAFDRDSPSSNIQMAITDGPYNGSNVLNIFVADKTPMVLGLSQNRRDTMKKFIGDDSGHSFFTYLPASIRDGKSHNVHIYALDSTGDESTLLYSKPITCPVGDMSISGPFNGKDIKISMTDRLAGAVDSLTYNGVEFTDSWDHGRQIQFAMQGYGQGECYNPTEAGSVSDDVGPNSSSILLATNKPSQNVINTSVSPAFWLLPNTAGTPFCTDKDKVSVNTSIVSPHTVYKQIQIGYNNLPNVIKTRFVVDIKEEFTRATFEVPAMYVNSNFTSFYKYDIANNDLQILDQTQGGKTYLFDYAKLDTTPGLMSTPNCSHAIGSYTAGATDKKGVHYGMSKHIGDTPNSSTNAMPTTIFMNAPKMAPIAFDSFVIVGTLEEVKNSMRNLYQMNPSDTQLPYGSLDGIPGGDNSCQNITGWAFDPKSIDGKVQVDFYTSVAGVERAVDSMILNQNNEFGLSRLNSNSRNVFSFPIPENMKNGQTHRMYARIKNSGQGGIYVNPPILGMAKFSCRG